MRDDLCQRWNFGRIITPVTRFSIIFTLLLTVPAPLMADELNDTSYANRRRGISLSVPEGWVITQQTGYPSILAFMLSAKGDGRVSLSHDLLQPQQKLAQYLKATNKTLQQAGFAIQSSKSVNDNSLVSWEVHATDKQSRFSILQYYLRRDNALFVYTLTCAAERLQHFRDELRSFVELTQLQRPRKSEG